MNTFGNIVYLQHPCVDSAEVRIQTTDMVVDSDLTGKIQLFVFLDTCDQVKGVWCQKEHALDDGCVVQSAFRMSTVQSCASLRRGKLYSFESVGLCESSVWSWHLLSCGFPPTCA